MTSATNGNKPSTDKNPSFVLLSPNKTTYEDRPIPTIHSPHDVLITIKYTGICGSDVHYWSDGRCGAFTLNGPLVLGHESSGVIHSVGSAVTTLVPGDRVALEPGVPCRRCMVCKSGRYNLCSHIQFAATPPTDGTLARYYVLPADFCYKLSDNVSLEEGALIEPLAVAVHIVRQAPVTPGMSVVVYGAGPVGLLCLAVALAFGASKTVAVDVIEERLKFAQGYAATHIFASRMEQGDEGAAKQLISECALNEGEGADVSIDASGAAPCIRQALRVLRPAGVYVQAGMGAPLLDKFPMMALMGKEITMRTSFRYKEGDYKLAVGLVADGKVDVMRLVTGVVGFAEAERAFWETKAASGVKTLIKGPE